MPVSRSVPLVPPKPPTPTGLVKVRVPVRHGVGVVQITPESGGPRHYLLQCVRSQLFLLRTFLGEGDEPRGPGDAYTVNLATGTCTCPDHQVRRRECKHLLALRALVKQGRL